jgi:hypothetical protein
MSWFTNLFKQKSLYQKSLYEDYLVEHVNRDGSIEHYNPQYMTPREDGTLDFSDNYAEYNKEVAHSFMVAQSNWNGINSLVSGTSAGLEFIGTIYPSSGSYGSVYYADEVDVSKIEYTVLECQNCGTKYTVNAKMAKEVLTPLICLQGGGRL